MVVFEVYLNPGADPQALLSAEVREETGAQVLSFSEASAVGFEGLTPQEGLGELYLVACRDEDSRFVQSRLEAHHSVSNYRGHSVAD